MAEIKLQKRYKYAGDIMPKLLDIGFDLDTASNFLNDIPDADVAPRAEVVDEIFKDILNIIREYSHSACIVKNNYGMTQAEYIGTDILKLKKKYTEGQK